MNFIRSLTLRQLQIFVVASRYTSFARAAEELHLTQPAVSRHLRVLRESGFARMRPAGQRRLYAIETAGLEHAEGWLADLRAQWSERLDALETEIRRGRRKT